VEQTCPSGTQYDLAGVLSFTTSDYDAYVAVVCVTFDGHTLYVSPPVLIDAGTSPSLSIASAGSFGQSPVAHVLLTVGDSYCYNNEPANKYAYSGLCDHTPTPLTDVLTYTYARLTDMANFIYRAAKSSTSQSLICSPLLLHGMYDMGSQTSVLLWNGQDMSGQDKLGVVELHVGRQVNSDKARVGGVVARTEKSGLQLGSSDICGVAEPFDGLVIDAWQLPQETTWSL